MALTDDLQNFLENILRGFDPTIDLSPGSPAQVQVIAPILSRIAVDPFDTDLPLFIRDRFVQEYPDLASDGGGMLEDILTNPMQTLLEPFKRELQTVKNNQSAQNPELLSDDEASALGANWFKARDEGGTATTSVRVYFAAPTTTSITSDKKAYTQGGLNYFPIQGFSITSTQMLFNREGTLYYLDIVVQAEKAGSEYNVKAGDISAIDNVPGAVKVANLFDVVDGVPREDNATYLGGIEASLSERSLVPKRGISARLFDMFQGGLRALQVVGAGEEGMDRDILQGAGEGYLHQAGNAVCYGDWIFLTPTYNDDGPNADLVIQAGDLIRFRYAITGALYEAHVLQVLSSFWGGSPLFLQSMILLDRSILPGLASLGTFALLKPGYITISRVPGGLLPVVVPDDTVHLGGHTDIFVRPSSDVQQSMVLPTVTDGDPLLTVLAASVTINTNKVSLGVLSSTISIGDVLVIETGAAAGSYRVINVGSPDGTYELRVDALFAASESGLRARVIRTVTVDLVEPKVPKLPFNTGSVSDLSTTIGSTLFRMLSINIASYGAAVGDVIRVLDGDDAGDFIIKSFDPVLCGQGPVVDRAATTSGANLRYEVFTSSPGITRPLVRVKSLEVLDSAGQGTGITVPYGDAVDARPIDLLEGAGLGKTVYDKEIFVFPDATGLWPMSNDASVYASNYDSRYSQSLVPVTGFTKFVTNHASNPIVKSEVDLPPFLWNGRRDKLMAFANKRDFNFTADPTGVHYTSEIAESKIGDSLNIIDGPNQGKYLIKDLRVLDLWGVDAHGHYKVALVQVEPELPIDPVRSGMEFIDDEGFYTPVSDADLLKIIKYATHFDHASGFYLPYLTLLGNALNHAGFVVSSGNLRIAIDALCLSGYEVGPSAHGTVRTYFLDPVSVELSFGLEPTIISSLLDASKTYRPALDTPPAQIYPQAEVPTPPTSWLRTASMNDPQDSYLSLPSGGAFATKGVQIGDVLEFHSAINDLPSRLDMGSSWVCVTQEGSNVVQAILPTNPDNKAPVEAGQLFFIETGPDSGAYTIVAVTSSTFGSAVIFTLDRVLTQSTLIYPSGSGCLAAFPASYAVVQTQGMVYPFTYSSAKTLVVKFSIDGGVTWITRTHTFSSSPTTYASATDVKNDINGDATFTGAMGDMYAVASGADEVFIRTAASTNLTCLYVDSSSTCLTAIKFTAQDVGRGDSLVLVGGTKKVYHATLSSANVGQWVDIYAAQSPAILAAGADAPYLGSFLVTAKGTEGSGIYTGWNYIELDRSADFPAGIAIGRWLLHDDAPVATPAATSGGGRLLSTLFVRCRMYDWETQQRAITIPWTTATPNPIDSTCTQQIQLLNVTTAAPLPMAAVGLGYGYGHKNPFRVVRPGVIRVSSSEMALHREGALYYMDIPVVGYGPGGEMNLPETEPLYIKSGAIIDGYTLDVQDPVFAYSTQEQVSILLPRAVLPIGSTPDLDNYISLSGQNVQVKYDNAPLVEDIQNFVSSPLDRVTVANMLARHFLPSYVFLEVEYSGGSNESVVAADLADLINKISPDDNQLRADAVQNKVSKRGARTVTLPITVLALTHDDHRHIRGLRSTNSIGGTGTAPFEGTYKQMFFIAGPDTSGELVRPSGEQIYLRRL